MDALAYNIDRDYPVDVILQIQRFVGAEPSGRWTAATVAAVIEFQEYHSLKPDGKVGPTTLQVIQGIDAQTDARGDESDTADHIMLGDDSGDPGDSDYIRHFDYVGMLDPIAQLRAWCANSKCELIDFRDLAKWPRAKTYPKEYGYPRDKSRADPPKGGIRRQWSVVDTIMLHTTAVGGMTYQRGIGLPCHLFLPKQDEVVLCHELELLLYHGHTANNFTVGLEISGASDWDSVSQFERGKALLRYFQAVRRSKLGPDAKCYVMTHRQSHWSRAQDPGKRIWQDLGEWAIDELGFGVAREVGSGRTIDDWRIDRTTPVAKSPQLELHDWAYAEIADGPGSALAMFADETSETVRFRIDPIADVIVDYRSGVMWARRSIDGVSKLFATPLEQREVSELTADWRLTGSAAEPDSPDSPTDSADSADSPTKSADYPPKSADYPPKSPSVAPDAAKPTRRAPTLAALAAAKLTKVVKPRPRIEVRGVGFRVIASSYLAKPPPRRITDATEP